MFVVVFLVIGGKHSALLLILKHLNASSYKMTTNTASSWWILITALLPLASHLPVCLSVLVRVLGLPCYKVYASTPGFLKLTFVQEVGVCACVCVCVCVYVCVCVCTYLCACVCLI